MRWTFIVALAACSAPPAAPHSTAPRPAPPNPEPPMSSIPAEATTAAPSVDEPSAPKAVTVKRGSWKRELEMPASSIGVGKRRVAVLTMDGERYASAFMREGDKWSDLKVPERMLASAGERDELRIWFGRDDRPRVMGTRYRPDGSGEMVYLRFKGNWRDKAGEIGRLDSPPEAPLFGILGHDDPEVVCKLGDTCIIKRLTGWTMIPPPPEILRVELAGTGAVGIGRTTAWRLAKEGWEPLSAAPVPWKSAPAGLWASADGPVWVAEPGRDLLHHWSGATWTSHPSPQNEPQALWGASPDDVWLAATEGPAHWDGARWSRLLEPTGAFEDVRGGFEGEIWLVGPAGVWRGQL